MSNKIIKVILLLFVVLVLTGGVVFLMSNKSKDLEDNSLHIVNLLETGEFDEVKGQTGIYFLKREEKGELSLSDIQSVLLSADEITYSEFLDGKNIKTYIYEVGVEDKILELSIAWEKQPKEWLISNIQILSEVEDLKIYADNISIELIEEILENIIQGKVDELSSLSEINSEILQKYNLNQKEYIGSNLQTAGILTQNAFGDYIVSPEKKNDDGQISVEIIFNKDTPLEFTYILIFNTQNKLTDFYVSGMEEKMTNSLLLSEPYVELEEVKTYDPELGGYVFDPKFDYDTLAKNAKEKQNLAIHHFTELDHYYYAYRLMSKDYKKHVSYESFNAYLNIMKKRTGVSFKTINPMNKDNYNIYHYAPYLEYTTMAEQDFKNPELYRGLQEKDDVFLGDYSEVLIQYNVDLIVDAENQEVIENIILRRSPVYYQDTEKNKKSTEGMFEELYYPINNGLSKDMSLSERFSIMDEKRDQLILALKLKDYETLWEIEKKYTALENIEEMKEMIDAFEGIVGSFEGQYAPRIFTDDKRRGFYIESIPFETADKRINILWVRYDFDLDIVDFNVALGIF